MDILDVFGNPFVFNMNFSTLVSSGLLDTLGCDDLFYDAFSLGFGEEGGFDVEKTGIGNTRQQGVQKEHLRFPILQCRFNHFDGISVCQATVRLIVFVKVFHHNHHSPFRWIRVDAEVVRKGFNRIWFNDSVISISRQLFPLVFFLRRTYVS